MRRILKGIVLLVLFLCLTCLLAQNADSVLNRYFRDIGGYEKWESVTTLYSSAKFTPETGPLRFSKQYAKAPYSLKLESQSISRNSVTVFSPQVCWIKSDEGRLIKSCDATKTPTDGLDSLMARIVQEGIAERKALREHPFDIIRSIQNKDIIAYLGKKNFRGEELEVIETIEYTSGSTATKKKYFKRVLYFDPETFLLKYSSLFHSGLSIPISNGGIGAYSDYRNVDGYILPFKREDYTANQTLQGVYEIQEISINQPLADAVFAFPSEK